jgi:hypothetical protein
MPRHRITRLRDDIPASRNWLDDDFRTRPGAECERTQDTETGALAQVQVEDEHVWAHFRDPIEGISFGVDGVDQLHVGQPINELDEAGGEQRGILDEQHA